jgi:hypothetical protein
MMDAINTAIKGIAVAGIFTAAFLPGRQTVAFTKQLFAGFQGAEGTAIKG